jgi:hypothetical protein
MFPRALDDKFIHKWKNSRKKAGLQGAGNTALPDRRVLKLRLFMLFPGVIPL